MPVPSTALKIQRLPANTVGRDFVVGDIHGCLAFLNRALELIGFDKDNDRLISVGDLVDRGPANRECAELVYETWFYACKGNHEDMMIRSLIDDDQRYQGTWLGNGGMWMFQENKVLLTDLARDLNNLPLVIVVGEGENRFNVVHGEIKHSTDWKRVPVTDQMIDDWVFDESEEHDMIWGRTLISNGHPTFPPPADQLWHDLEKMSLTFCGHTPVRETVMVQRQMYIDNGAVFNAVGSYRSYDNKLVFACPNEKKLYQYVSLDDTLTTVDFADIQQLS